MDWTWPVGLAAAVFVLSGTAALTLGRRLALHRERTGYVREEDLRYRGLEGEGFPHDPRDVP